MPALTTFLLSLFFLLAFIAFRFFEQGRGRRFFSHARLSADRKVERFYYSAVMGNIPSEYRSEASRFLYRLAHDTLVFLVDSLRSIEKPLTRLSYRMRHSAPKGNGKGASAYLKTIAPEKKEIETRDAL